MEVIGVLEGILGVVEKTLLDSGVFVETLLDLSVFSETLGVWAKTLLDLKEILGVLAKTLLGSGVFVGILAKTLGDLSVLVAISQTLREVLHQVPIPPLNALNLVLTSPGTAELGRGPSVPHRRSFG